MKFVAIIVIILVIAVAVVLVIAATRPNSFRIERSIRIKAPPETAFAMVNDFRQWSHWSPYEALDPDLKRTYGGAPSGVGAAYEYEGKKAGQGRMTIVQSDAPNVVRSTLTFIKPMQAENMAEFTFRPQGEETVVTWAMYGPNPFMFRVMGVLFNVDRMVGRDFEKGLANMKSVSEGAAAATAH